MSFFVVSPSEDFPNDFERNWIVQGPQGRTGDFSDLLAGQVGFVPQVLNVGCKLRAYVIEAVDFHAYIIPQLLG